MKGVLLLALACLALGLVSDIQSRIIVNVAKRTTAAPLGLISPYVPTQDR